MLRSRTFPALAFFLLVAFAPRARAQTPAESRDTVPPATWLQPGAVVRVSRHHEREPTIGSLLRADSLVQLQRLDGGGVWSAPARAVRTMEVRGEALVRRHPQVATRVGFLLGAIPSVAAIAIGLQGDREGGCDVDTLCPSFAALAVIGGVLATGITTGLGAIVDHHRPHGTKMELTWSRVRVPVRMVQRDSAAAAPRP